MLNGAFALTFQLILLKNKTSLLAKAQLENLLLEAIRLSPKLLPL